MSEYSSKDIRLIGKVREISVSLFMCEHRREAIGQLAKTHKNRSLERSHHRTRHPGEYTTKNRHVRSSGLACVALLSASLFHRHVPSLNTDLNDSERNVVILRKSSLVSTSGLYSSDLIFAVTLMRQRDYRQ
jgi:hypothetical protein